MVGIYCNTDWYHNILDTDALPYDYWIASYGDNDGRPDKRPSIKNMAAWQYTSQGIVPGISGRADLDIFYKEYESRRQQKRKPAGSRRMAAGVIIWAIQENRSGMTGTGIMAGGTGLTGQE